MTFAEQCYEVAANNKLNLIEKSLKDFANIDLIIQDVNFAVAKGEFSITLREGRDLKDHHFLMRSHNDDSSYYCRSSYGSIIFNLKYFLSQKYGFKIAMEKNPSYYGAFNIIVSWDMENNK